MSFSQKWRNFQNITEALEQTPFKSAAQKRYKAQRKRNDIYTTKGGIKNKKSGKPFTGKMRRFGTDRLRFEGLEEELSKSALQSFDVHDTLEPKVWQGESLDPEVRESLLKIVKDFIIDLPFDVSLEDITLTGSLANYNWSRFSDIDLHILVDFESVDENRELVKEFFRQLQANWNTRHDIDMKGYEVEIYIQDSSEGHISTGIYSIQDDEWLTKPKPEPVSVDYPNVKKKAEDISDRIDYLEQAMEEEDEDILDMIDRLRAKIRNMRRSGLETSGQYSVENLAFKVLRRSQELKRLADLKTKAYDEAASIEEAQEIMSKICLNS
jgi:predicted nucleotidyltransferase